MSDPVSSVAPDTTYVPGVAVAVLRDAIELMETQGQAIAEMIDAAATVADVAPPAALSDPYSGRQIDLFA